MRRRRLKPEDRPRIGFLSAYVPEELLHATGFTPVFLFPTPEDRGRARVHLPGFTCWVAGSALDRALAGDLDDLAGMVLAQTCDTVQGLTDLWRRNVPGVPLLHFGMPTRLDGPAVHAYLLAELRDLRGRLQEVAGHAISDDALWESIALYNRTRALIRGLYARAADFAPSELYALVRAAFQMPKETFLQETANRGQGSPSPPLSSSPLLLLVGPALADPLLFDVIEQAGTRVAGDLLDLGERYFAVDAVDAVGGAGVGDPLEALAGRLLADRPRAGVPTPTKYRPDRSRADHLLALVEERGARGVIFARQKFCDPHGFDIAQMARVLDEAGVPHLLVELEQASQAGQMRTRVEAFVEMLR